MKIEIPKITVAVRLAEYAPEFGEETLVVWVNPPIRLLDRWDELVPPPAPTPLPHPPAPHSQEGIGGVDGETEARRERRKILAELWGQGPEVSRWSVEQVEELERQAMETDPGLLLWMAQRTFAAIYMHRMQLKKK